LRVPTGREVYPCFASILVTKISVRSRRLISSASALSRNNSIASRRLAVASSTVAPWLATSSSGHNAAYRSPSFSMIAVYKVVDIRIFQFATDSDLPPAVHYTQTRDWSPVIHQGTAYEIIK